MNLPLHQFAQLLAQGATVSIVGDNAVSHETESVRPAKPQRTPSTDRWGNPIVRPVVSGSRKANVPCVVSYPAMPRKSVVKDATPLKMPTRRSSVDHQARVAVRKAVSVGLKMPVRSSSRENLCQLALEKPHAANTQYRKTSKPLQSRFDNFIKSSLSQDSDCDTVASWPPTKPSRKSSSVTTTLSCLDQALLISAEEDE